jgi:hypothetical protein
MSPRRPELRAGRPRVPRLRGRARPPPAWTTGRASRARVCRPPTAGPLAAPPRPLPRPRRAARDRRERGVANPCTALYAPTPVHHRYSSSMQSSCCIADRTDTGSPDRAEPRRRRHPDRAARAALCRAHPRAPARARRAAAVGARLRAAPRRQPAHGGGRLRPAAGAGADRGAPAARLLRARRGGGRATRPRRTCRARRPPRRSTPRR